MRPDKHNVEDLHLLVDEESSAPLIHNTNDIPVLGYGVGSRLRRNITLLRYSYKEDRVIPIIYAFKASQLNDFSLR